MRTCFFSLSLSCLNYLLVSLCVPSVFSLEIDQLTAGVPITCLKVAECERRLHGSPQAVLFLVSNKHRALDLCVVVAAKYVYGCTVLGLRRRFDFDS